MYTIPNTQAMLGEALVAVAIGSVLEDEQITLNYKPTVDIPINSYQAATQFAAIEQKESALMLAIPCPMQSDRFKPNHATVILPAYRQDRGISKALACHRHQEIYCLY